MNKSQTCIHARNINNKTICDISKFVIDGTHCAGCVSYEYIDDFQVCDVCKKIVKKSEIYYIEKKNICKECINNGYGEWH